MAPVRGGYLEGMGGWSRPLGTFARAELGVRPSEAVDLFAGGQWAQRVEPSVGVGFRWRFDLK